MGGSCYAGRQAANPFRHIRTLLAQASAADRGSVSCYRIFKEPSIELGPASSKKEKHDLTSPIALFDFLTKVMWFFRHVTIMIVNKLNIGSDLYCNAIPVFRGQPGALCGQCLVLGQHCSIAPLDINKLVPFPTCNKDILRLLTSALFSPGASCKSYVHCTNLIFIPYLHHLQCHMLFMWRFFIIREWKPQYSLFRI